MVAGAMLKAGDIAQLFKMWQEDRQRADALAAEVENVREQLAAAQARAEVALRLLASPEAPKRPWWRVW